MRAILVVVRDIGREQPLQMRLADGNHVIQQFATAAADPALGYPVLPRTPVAVRTALMFMKRIAADTSVPYLES